MPQPDPRRLSVNSPLAGTKYFEWAQGATTDTLPTDDPWPELIRNLAKKAPEEELNLREIPVRGLFLEAMLRMKNPEDTITVFAGRVGADPGDMSKLFAQNKGHKNPNSRVFKHVLDHVTRVADRELEPLDQLRILFEYAATLPPSAELTKGNGLASAGQAVEIHSPLNMEPEDWRRHFGQFDTPGRAEYNDKTLRVARELAEDNNQFARQYRAAVLDQKAKLKKMQKDEAKEIRKAEAEAKRREAGEKEDKAR